jgi:predicted lipid-binding transport protein (Tim44 family)
MNRFGRLLPLLAMTTVLVLATGDYADARMGRGGSFGSRGSRTFQAPSATQTAPGAASPINRSVTQPGSPGMSQRGPAAAGAQAGRGFFGGGFGRGLMGGLIGAGLIGMLFGNGLFGGLGGLSSILGLLLQIGIIFFVARLLIAWFRRRQQEPATVAAGAGNTSHRQPQPQPSAMGGGFGGSGFGFGQGATAAASQDIAISAADQDLFEQALVKVQMAYGREDLGQLRTLVTPELLTILSEDFADNASRGVINELSDVKLLQGDLSEAWRENGAEYATVAMRFELRDVMKDRATGRVVDGDTSLTEATEIWTFRRVPRGAWMLSAVQQA